MKKTHKILLAIFTVSIVAIGIYTSCSKDTENNGKINNKDSKLIVERANKIYDNLPEIRIVGSDQLLVLNTKNGFSFAEPNSGFTFSSNNGVEWVPNANGGGCLYVSAASFGPNSTGGNGGGGGTVVAGNTNLEINYTFCLSADDEAMNLGFIDNDFKGVSMIIGLSGDLEALQNQDTASNPLDFFNGFAVYIVYASPASGNYDVIDWFENIDADSTKLTDHAFAYVLDFKMPALYFSKSGQLNVSGGSIGFTGRYFGFNFNFLNDEEEGFNEDDIFEVDGFGTMGCN